MWQKDGPGKRITDIVNGKWMESQKFIKSETGETLERSLFTAQKNSSVIFPLTADNHVIMTRQYRWGGGQIYLEPPAGNIEPDETPEQAAGRELREETGYTSSQLIALPLVGMKMWIDPAAFQGYHYYFFTPNCEKVGEPELDRGEELKHELFPLQDWLRMCWAGQINDVKSLAITFMVLPYLIDYTIR